MSKKRKVSPEEMAKRVAQITDTGYRVKQFETFHYRFESAVDFWPSTCRWMDITGSGRRGTVGNGAESLLDYLAAHYPVRKSDATGKPATARERKAELAEIERVNQELIEDCSREVPFNLTRTCQQLFICQKCWKLVEHWETLRQLTQVSADDPVNCEACI